jgi:cytochrome c-type biogenesis protein CcmH
MLSMFAGLLLAMPSLAVIETYEFSDPKLEQRYRVLSQELRCPKCQNQNIADSNAPISQDLRKLLYEKLESGASDDVILQDMVARYGEFVRYRPAAQGAALWLWLAPVIMLLAGVVLVLLLLRRAKRPTGAPREQLSPAERAQLDEILKREVGDQ